MKAIAFIFGLFITLTIAVTIVVKSMINPNDYINELERSLSTQNVDITIEEDVSWLSLPSLGLKLNKVSLERGDELYSEINEITVRLNYLSLINLPTSGLDGIQLNVRIRGGSVIIQSQFSDFPLKVSNIDLAVNGFSKGLDDLKVKLFATLLDKFDIQGKMGLKIKSITETSQIIEIPVLELEIDLLKISGNLLLDFSESSFEGMLNINDFNLAAQLNKLRQFFPLLPIPSFEDKTALTNVSLVSNFSTNLDEYSEYLHEINIDSQKFIIEAETDINAGTMNNYIQGDALNIDKYMTEETENSPLGAVFASLLIPSYIWGQQSSSEISIDKLVAKNLIFSNLFAALENSPNKANLSSFSADLKDGGINGFGRLELDNSLNFELSAKTDNVSISSLLPISNTSNVDGKLFANVKLRGSGYDLKSIRGSGSFVINDFEILTIDMENEMCAILEPFTKSKYTMSLANKTLLENLDGKMQIDKGDLLIRDLKTKLGNMDLRSRGELRVNNNFQFDVTVRNNTEFTSENGCKIPNIFINKDIPISCSGNLDQTFDVMKNCQLDPKIIETAIKGKALEKIYEKMNPNIDLFKRLIK
ncbi:MAG: hypothetical protein CM15mP51_01660 [Porticoccaceae bacterium]|nr:MAG: hypothetical protein CM15mP51_01660 [Porticoccaceae bacterium]